MYPLFPTFAFLGFVLSLIPLPWHIQAWNSGTCAFMLWTAISCLIGFVNSTVWSDNLRNPAPVWCDISSKIIIGVSVGIPAATLCISRRLYYLTSGSTVSITHEDKRRMVIIDLCIAVGIPAIIMTLHYIVQGHRFDILEDIGCYPVVYNTLPAYFLFFMWPVVLGVISFVFSALTLRSFWIRRLQFNQLITSNSSMSVSRYLRLVLLAIIDMMCTIPLGIYTIWLGNKGVGLAPWISWEDTHFNFSRVALVPALIWRSDRSRATSVELTRWLPVLCAFLFFALFGFASEAQRCYKIAFWRVMRVFGVTPAPTTPSKAGLKTLSLGSWNKPSKNTSTITTETTIGSPPAYVPKLPTSPTSFNSTSKKPYRSHSFSTSASTHAGHDDDLELSPYSKSSYLHSQYLDIEKNAGLSPLTSTSVSYDSEARTLCAESESESPVYHARRKPSQVPQDVGETPLPSPWSFGSSSSSSRFGQSSEADTDMYQMDAPSEVAVALARAPTPSALEVHSHAVAPHLLVPSHSKSSSTTSLHSHAHSHSPSQTQSQPLPNLHLHPYAPKMKTSNGSMRTITSPDRDRFYIVSEGNERAQTPESPRPFTSTAPPAGSSEGAVPGRGIQVMVYKTEVRSTEEL